MIETQLKHIVCVWVWVYVCVNVYLFVSDKN